jgi:hypothetical protein
LEIVREIGDRREEGGALWHMALALGQRGDAIASAEASLLISNEIEDPNAEMVRQKLDEWLGESPAD